MALEFIFETGMYFGSLFIAFLFGIKYGKDKTN